MQIVFAFYKGRFWRLNDVRQKTSGKSFINSEIERKAMRRYPVQLDVSGRTCVVAGAGKVALSKTRTLLDCGSLVTVIAPDIDQGFSVIQGVTIVRRPFAWDDLDGAFLVIAATNDSAQNEAILLECRKRGIICSRADLAEGSDFLAAPVSERHGIIASVSTEGKAPALAVRLRDELLDSLPDDMPGYVAFLAEARQVAKERVHDQRARAELARQLASRQGYAQWAALDETERRQWLETLMAEYIPREER